MDEAISSALDAPPVEDVQEWGKRLLAPISEAAPCGEALLYDVVYDQIREARREEDPDLPQGVWEREVKRADWAKVRALCEDALLSRTKDVQIAAWLTEARLALDGVAGLVEGLEVLLALAQMYWDDIHPRMEEGDLDARLAPFRWVSTALAFRLKFVRLTVPAHGDGRAYTFAEWEEAEYYERLAARGRKAARAADEARPTREAITLSAHATDAAYHAAMASGLERADGIAEALATFLDERCGDEAPSFGALREGMMAIHGRVLSWRGEDIRRVEREEADVAEKSETVAQTEGAPANQTAGSISSRAEAYAMLAMAAEYLMRTEPHSPTPYLVQRAVAWGDMSLGELYSEILGEGAELGGILALLGIPKKQSE